MRVATYAIAVPAFGYLWFSEGDPFKTLLGTVSIVAFALIALLQMLFVFRAYWRMDI